MEINLPGVSAPHGRGVRTWPIIVLAIPFCRCPRNMMFETRTQLGLAIPSSCTPFVCSACTRRVLAGPVTTRRVFGIGYLGTLHERVPGDLRVTGAIYLTILPRNPLSNDLRKICHGLQYAHHTSIIGDMVRDIAPGTPKSPGPDS